MSKSPMTATEVKQRQEEWEKKVKKHGDDLAQALVDLTLQALAARSNTKPDS